MTNTREEVAFDYFKNNKALRIAVCVLMREFGTISIDGCESDDEAMDRYLSDEDGEVELQHFRIIGNEILGAIAASNSKYVPMLVEALKRIAYRDGLPNIDSHEAQEALNNLPEELRG